MVSSVPEVLLGGQSQSLRIPGVIIFGFPPFLSYVFCLSPPCFSCMFLFLIRFSSSFSLFSFTLRLYCHSDHVKL